MLALIATTFGANHIVARIAFDQGAGVALAVLLRSGLCAMVLAGLMLVLKSAPKVPKAARGWLLLAGVLVAVQSLSVYSAVARIPVALALLVFNLFPVLFVLLTWLTGGARPRSRVFWLVGVILFGLCLVLNVPAALRGTPWTAQFTLGVSFALCAALSFSGVLWMTERKLHAIAGVSRTLYLQLIVVAATTLVALSGALPDAALAPPRAASGWWALVAVAVIYGVAFSTLFVIMPRLDMARNAPALNVEPVATLFMGWFVLGQTLIGIQWGGAAIVMAAVIGLSLAKK